MKHTSSTKIAIAGHGLTARGSGSTFEDAVSLSRRLHSAMPVMRRKPGGDAEAESLRSAGSLLAAALAPLVIALATRAIDAMGGGDVTQRYLFTTLAALALLFGITAGGTTPGTRRPQ